MDVMFLNITLYYLFKFNQSFSFSLSEHKPNQTPSGETYYHFHVTALQLDRVNFRFNIRGKFN